jgi:DNA-binding CsgD family transcriptional regulator
MQYFTYFASNKLWENITITINITIGAPPAPQQVKVEPIDLPPPPPSPAPAIVITEPVISYREGISLSPRELTTIKSLAMGDSNKHMARRLNITEATVKVHVKSVLRKLRLKNRTQAAAWWYEQGLKQFNGVQVNGQASHPEVT